MFFNKTKRSLPLFTCNGIGIDFLPAGRKFIKDGNIEVAVNHQRECAWNWRCAHDKHVRMIALGGKRSALCNTEPVLFVRNDQPQPLKRNALRQKRVSADDQLYLSGLQRAQNFTLLCRRHGASMKEARLFSLFGELWQDVRFVEF